MGETHLSILEKWARGAQTQQQDIYVLILINLLSTGPNTASIQTTKEKISFITCTIICTIIIDITHYLLIIYFCHYDATAIL